MPSSNASPSAPQAWALPPELRFEWHDTIDSTSSELMRRAREGALTQATLIAAGAQTAGRGRMGRAWTSRAGDTLMWSMAYAVPARLALDGLSLALGVGIAEALNDALHAPAHAPLVKLKWPNDWLLASSASDLKSYKKLAGLLIETLPYNRNRNGALVAERWLIMGFGLNLHLTADDNPALRSEACSLDTVWTAPLAMTLAHIGSLTACACLASLKQFANSGFNDALRSRWQTLHAYQDRRVRYTPQTGEALQGIAQGVDATGALLIQRDLSHNAAYDTGLQASQTSNDQILRITSTEGSLRLA